MAVPHSTQSAATRSVGLIQQDPFQAPNVKKIMKHLYTNVYRVRLGDYRLVYAVGTASSACWAIGRAEIYKRHLEMPPSPSLANMSRLLHPSLHLRSLPPRPSTAAGLVSRGQRCGFFSPAAEEPGPRAEGGAFEELLKRWGIPEQERRLILGCRDPGKSSSWICRSPP